MTMLNTPVFGAAHPKTFLDLMIAKTPDPATGKPDPEKMKAFKASHPDNRAQAEFLAKNNPPASYTTSSYFGIHTFKFIDRDDKTTLVRWRFAPQDGERRLSDAELKSAAPDFLEPALMERVKQGPVRWDMSAFWHINDAYSLTLEGINLTDEVERLYTTGDGTMNLIREINYSGRQLFLGIRWSF